MCTYHFKEFKGWKLAKLHHWCEVEADNAALQLLLLSMRTQYLRRKLKREPAFTNICYVIVKHFRSDTGAE